MFDFGLLHPAEAEFMWHIFRCIFAQVQNGRWLLTYCGERGHKGSNHEDNIPDRRVVGRYSCVKETEQPDLPRFKSTQILEK